MSADGPAGDRPRAKRMLPSVSDVVRELQADAPADPSLLFKVARQVCAEELGRVKLGKEAVALDVLVERAKRILDPSREKPPGRDDSGAFAFDLPSGQIPAVHSSASGSMSAVPENEDPFNVASAPADLGWGNDPKDSPLSDSTEVLTSYTSEPGAAPDMHARSSFESRGPSDETLSRLDRDAHAIDLQDAVPRGQAPAVASWGYDENAATERMDPRSIPAHDEVLFQAPPKKRSSMLPMLMIIGGVVAVLAAAYFVVGRPYLEKTESSSAVLAPRSTRTRPRPAGSSAPSGPTTSSPNLASTAVPARTKPAIAVFEPEPEPGSAKIVDGTSRPSAAKSAAPKPTAAPVMSATKAPAVSIVSKPPSTATSAPEAAPRPSPVSARPMAVADTTPPASVPARVSKGSAHAGALESPDWAGKPATYVVHFTSYKDRQNAEKDAARLGREFGRTGYAVSVDLGGKGVWYRAVLGDFASVEEAQLFRNELAAKKTPSLGLVYHLTSP